MLNKSRAAVVVSGLLCLVSLAGCGSTERAVVEFSYSVDATRGLPEGMRTIMIVPAKLGPNTDEQWSDMCITIMQSLVNESKNSFGTDVEVTDRRDTQILFDEADLAAAGMSKGGSQGGQLDAAQGAHSVFHHDVIVAATFPQPAESPISPESDRRMTSFDPGHRGRWRLPHPCTLACSTSERSCICRKPRTRCPRRRPPGNLPDRPAKPA